MRKKTLLTFFLLFSLIFLFSKNARASHLYGGEFTYEYIGPSGNALNPFRYKILYKIYTDNPSSGSTVNFRFYHKNGTLIRQLANVYPTTLSGTLPLPVPSSCPIPGLPVLRLMLYDLTVDLPMSFDGYYATASIFARNTNITNLASPGSTNLFTYIEIPPSMLPSKSPVFTDTAFVVIFAGDTATIQNSTTDADGDSRIYSFNNPFTDGNYFNFIPSATVPTRIQYANTFSFAQPFGPGGHASINAATGLTKYYAPLAGNYVVSVKVNEYRNINGNDVLIGSIMRDIQIIVRNAPPTTNNPPALQYTGPRTFTINEGQAIPALNFTFTDPDPGQILTITASSPLLDGPGNKNGSFNGSPAGPGRMNNVASGATATFTYTAACGEANTYPLNITITDNACPPASITESFQIVVVSVPSTQAPTDITLTVSAIDENIAPGTVIATVQTTDGDFCDTHTTTFVTGTGSTDNAAFTLTPAGTLIINSSPDFETQSTYTIRVRSTDPTNLFYEKAITISVNDIDEIAPTAVLATTAASPTAISPIPVTVTFSEVVIGFTSPDVTISGGTISNFSGSGDTYTFDVVPSGNGTILLDIPAGVAADSTGNLNEAAPQLSIVYNNALGVKENAISKMNFQVYPNPSSGTLNLEFPNTDEAEITVTDLAGKAILQKQLKGNAGSIKESLDLKAASGTYLLMIRTKEQFQTRRLVIQ